LRKSLRRSWASVVESLLTFRLSGVDTLVLDSADPRAKAQAQHGEGGEVDLGIAVGVGIMLFDLELAFIIKQTVEYEGGITVGAQSPLGRCQAVHGECSAHTTGGKRCADSGGRVLRSRDCRA